MKKLYTSLYISVLLLACLLPAVRIMAQVAHEAGGTTDSIAHAAQPGGIASHSPGGSDEQPGAVRIAKGTPYFYAYIDNSDPAIRRVTLRWEMESEFNTDHFVLQRSSALNPTHFDPLHEVVAIGDSAGQTYTDMDIAPDGIVSYYRLKIVLKNGDAFYSPIVAIDMSGKTSLALSPSVLTSGGTLHLNTNTDQRPPMTINFFDAGGRMIATYLVNNSYFDINTSGWTRGIYIYRITDGRHPLIESGKIMIM